MPEPDLPADEAAALQLALAIADGTPVDWADMSSTTSSSLPGWCAPSLAQIDRIMEGHRALYAEEPALDDSAVVDTLLTEARRTSESPGALQVDWGPLVVREKVGRGSFGDVYRAWDPNLEREVALKLVPATTTTEAVSGAFEEGRLLARVRHPNVVTVYGVEQVEGRVGIWMEFIRGRTLADEIGDRGPIDPVEAARIGVDVCQALSAVHEAGLLHRDVKAQNVMRDTNGRVVLGDFGTGRMLTEPAGPDGHLAGTPLYLAPEVLARGPATPAGDQYSVGVLLYHLVTGDYPVRGRALAEVREAHRRQNKVSLVERLPEALPAFIDAIERALDPDPTRRYENVAELGGALSALVNSPNGDITAQDVDAHKTSRQRWLAGAIVTGLIAISLAGGIWVVAPRENAVASAPLELAPPFQQDDYVLVTQFENLTDEPSIDAGTLGYALELALSDSRHLHVAQPERVEDALRMMQRPSDTLVDRAVGREVALRDGGIRLLLAGRVETQPSGYLLTVQMVDAQDGRVVDSVQGDASDKNGLPFSIQRLAAQVRERLGETFSNVETSQQVLERVTTPSMRALRLYSQGYRRYRMGGLAEGAAAAELFRGAIAEDQNFASAYNMLGWAVHYQDREEALQHWTRAVELASNMVERDRLFIEGTYLQQTGQLDQARAKYEALLDFYPDHYYAVNNLRDVYVALGLGRPVELPLQRAAARPNDPQSQIQAAKALTGAWQLERARPYVDRARALFAQDPTASNDGVFLDFFTAYEYWFRGQIEETLRDVDHIAQTLRLKSPGDRGVYTVVTAHFFAALGQFEKAHQVVSAEIPEDWVRELYFARIADAAGDAAAVRGHLSAMLELGQDLFVFDLYRSVRAGMTVDAHRILVPPGFDSVAWEAGTTFPQQLIQGEEALGRGDWDQAAELLEAAIDGMGRNTQPSIEPSFFPEYYQASELLATAWQRIGDETQALQVLETATHVQAQYPRLWGVVPRFRVQARLAREYRRLGRVEEAVEIEDEVLHMLRYADADHQVVNQIKEAQSAGR